MKTKFILIVVLSLSLQQLTISQTTKTCDTTPEDSLLDLNTITKCTIEKDHAEVGQKKQVKIQVSSRRRVVRNRDTVQGVHMKKNAKINSVKQNSSLIGKLDLNNEKVVEKVPFNHVEEIPLFKACEKVPLMEQKKCFNKEIANHISHNFNYPSEAHRNNIQGRVLAQFVIDKNGEVTDLNLRGPYKGQLLEDEAKRIIKKLPKFKPGKHHGKTVKVKYGVPISFRIPGKAPSNVKKKSETINLAEAVNFNNVDQIPTFKSCKSDYSHDCFNKELVKHVNKYFYYPKEAVDKNIEGKILIYFVINKNGEVVNVKTRGPKGSEPLKKVTRKLFDHLPVLSPGKHQGKTANVKHVFPIEFKLD